MSQLCRLDQAMPLAEELEHPLPAFQIGLVDGKLGGTKGAKDCSTATFDPVRSV